MSVRDSGVGDCNHVEVLVYRTHPLEDIRDAEANGIGKGRDMELALLRVGPGRISRRIISRGIVNVHQQRKSLESLSTRGHRASQRLF